MRRALRAFAAPVLCRHTRAASTLRGANALDIQRFQAMLGPGGVIPGGDDGAAKYSVDWMKQYGAPASAVLLPSTTEQVATILRYCHEARIGVVPQGGNTGLVGGSVPTVNEVVLSLERFNRVCAIDESAGVATVEAGVVLEALDTALSAHGWMVPLDLGAKGSCMIGGNVSTNAGGLRLVRYGSLHGSVLGLEVVTGDGRVLDMLTSLRKHNVGYPLHHLFIGAEGTLGIVTKVALQAVPRPTSVQVALLAVPDFPSVVAVARAARRQLGEILSAVEFCDGMANQLTTETLGLSNPLAGKGGSSGVDGGPMFMVLETHGFAPEADTARLQAFLEQAAAASPVPLVTDGVVAQDVSQARALWRLREDCAVAMSRRGHVYKYDVSLPLPLMYDLVRDTRARLEAAGLGAARGIHAVGYGHVGDGNLHLNVATPGRGQDYQPALAALLEPWVFEWVLARGGSVSAEHGLGVSKAAWLPPSRPPAVVAAMRALKTEFDPAGILNPGKVLPPLE